MQRVPIVNLLPATYLLERKCRKKKNQIKLGVVVLTVLLSAIMLGEIAGIAYNAANGTTIAVSQQAQKEHARLTKENEILKKSINLINHAYSEDTEMIKVVDFLAASKPNDIKLLRLEVVNGVVSIEGHSVNPGAFNDYVENLKMNKDLVSDSRLEKISSPAPAYKTGVIKAALSETN